MFLLNYFHDIAKILNTESCYHIMGKMLPYYGFVERSFNPFLIDKTFSFPCDPSEGVSQNILDYCLERYHELTRARELI